MWRVVMPTPGDCNTYGACEVFGGRVAETLTERGKITLTINSFLDVVNQSVPPNVIDSQNIYAGYSANTPVLADSETQVPQFVVPNPTAKPGNDPTTDLLGRCLSPTPNKIYSLNKLQFGYIVFNAGSSLAGYFSKIAVSGDSGSISGIHYNHFTLYQPWPWPPTTGDTFYAATKPPVATGDGTLGFPVSWFPYVPAPESAA
jgi:hypothetical protein